MGWTVLCVSKSSTALVTRKLILERAGYSVLSTSDPAEAGRIFAGSGVHAVIVGDSVPANQRLELARTLKLMDRSVPIIALNNTSGAQIPAGIVDEQLESLGDPHLLLETLSRVLARDGDPKPRSATILLLADRRHSQAARVLKGAGYRLMTTFTPDHAVAICVNNPVDAVILDQEHFVQTEGWSVAQSLKMIRNSLCVVLVVRGKIVGHDLPAGVDLVVADHDPQSLVDSLKNLLTGS